MAGSETIAPRSVEEAAEAIRAAAAAKGRRLAPVGAGTRRVPIDADIALDLRELGGAIDHEPENLVAACDAGTTLADFAAALAEHGQRLPLDPASAPGATVGGLLGTNGYGPLRLAHGTVRDALIGTEFLRFDGALIRVGGRVVKNVAGYDVGKLLIGAEGALGAIVRARFKLTPIPEETATFVVATHGDDADARVAALRAERRPCTAAMFEDGMLTLTVEGSAGVGLQHAGALRGERVEPESLAPVDAAVIVRAHFPPADAPTVRAAAPGWRERSFPGAGVAWFSRNDVENADEAIGAIRGAVRPLGGWIEIERAPESVRSPRLVIEGRALAVMRRVKEALDPIGVFTDGPLARASR